MQQHVARHLEQEVADEEQARAQAVDRVAETQRTLHLQLGKTDVDAVQVGEQETHDEQRHDAPVDLAEQVVIQRLPRDQVGGQGTTGHGCNLLLFLGYRSNARPGLGRAGGSDSTSELKASGQRLAAVLAVDQALQAQRVGVFQGIGQ